MRVFALKDDGSIGQMIDEPHQGFSWAVKQARRFRLEAPMLGHAVPKMFRFEQNRAVGSMDAIVGGY